jgi:spore maturation protein CgeB
MNQPIKIAFFGSSLVSAYWNGAATYYRGILKSLSLKGYSITFYEPNAYSRQENRDLKQDPDYAKVIIYQPTLDELNKCLEQAASADIIIKASGVGVYDQELENKVLTLSNDSNQIIFWDVDAPATLDRVLNNDSDYFRQLIPQFDQFLTYGGGFPVENKYLSLGAKACTSIYNAFDPETHHKVEPVEFYACDLAFLGNRLPDRESRVDAYFFEVAKALPEKQFILGGSGWEDKPMTSNIKYVGHVPTADHNALNSSAKAVLNISRDSMAAYGFSPATRVFEAAGAGACLISDAWEGISQFFDPGREILIADSPDHVIQYLINFSEVDYQRIGENICARAYLEHTYAHRVDKLDALIQPKLSIS